MPKESSRICTMDFMVLVQTNQIARFNDKEVWHRNCAHPPPAKVLQQNLIELIETNMHLVLEDVHK